MYRLFLLLFCYTSLSYSTVTPFIFGGEEVVTSNYLDFEGHLYSYSGFSPGGGSCTASLISGRYLITAAHCFYGFNSDDTTIKYNNLQFSYFRPYSGLALNGATQVDPSALGIWIKGNGLDLDTLIKPGYSAKNVSLGHDIAILDLKTVPSNSLDFCSSFSVHSDCNDDFGDTFIEMGHALPLPQTDVFLLPDPNSGSHSISLKNSEPLLVSGYGVFNNSGAISSALMYTYMAYLTADDASQVFGSTAKPFYEYVVSALHDGFGRICQGDSGSPLVYEDSSSDLEKKYVMGVLSVGIATNSTSNPNNCAYESIYGGYTSTRSYSEWILEQIDDWSYPTLKYATVEAGNVHTWSFWIQNLSPDSRILNLNSNSLGDGFSLKGSCLNNPEMDSYDACSLVVSFDTNKIASYSVDTVYDRRLLFYSGERAIRFVVNDPRLSEYPRNDSSFNSDEKTTPDELFPDENVGDNRIDTVSASSKKFLSSVSWFYILSLSFVLLIRNRFLYRFIGK